MAGPQPAGLNVPVVETERLLLRPFAPGDLDAQAAMAADPEVARYVGGVQDRGDAWRTLAMFVGHWAWRGYGPWAVERRSDGRMIGRCGLWFPEGWPEIEVGWAFARDAWGQGYATEAARASVEWGFGTLGLPRICSLIAAENTRSARVAGRLGMRLDRTEVVRGVEAQVYLLDRPS